MSDFECPVVRIPSKEKHSNADTLSITEIEGNPVVFRSTDFSPGDLAVYIPIESLIPEGSAWVQEHAAHLKFKKGFHRVKAVRLRGVFSMGMLVPYRALETTDAYKGDVQFGKEGQDVSEVLGIAKYEEPEDRVPQVHGPARPRTLGARIISKIFAVLAFFGYRRKAKVRPFPIYELSNYRKVGRAFKDGEEVVVTEKIHGQNFAATVNKKGKLVVSSHKVIRGAEDNSNFWRVARELELEKKLNIFPGIVFYGEIYGHGVQDLTYGVPPGELRCQFFDVYDTAAKEFLDYDDALNVLSIVHLPPVPIIYIGTHTKEKMLELSQGETTLTSTKQIREGVVIRRRHGNRCVLKLVSEDYLLRPHGTERH